MLTEIEPSSSLDEDPRTSGSGAESPSVVLLSTLGLMRLEVVWNEVLQVVVSPGLGV